MKGKTGNIDCQGIKCLESHHVSALSTLYLKCIGEDFRSGAVQMVNRQGAKIET